MSHTWPWLALALAAAAVFAAKPEIVPIEFRGWKATRLQNGLVELTVTPQLGGRIISYRLGDKEFLWVNAELAGTPPSSTGLAPDGSWLNYGGEKLWPAPQGWGSPDHWPGPPDAVLDGGPHQLSMWSGDGNVALRLTSQDDPRCGIRFSRSIRLFPGTTRVSIEATMTNIDAKPRRWGIWSVAQNDATAPHGKTWNSLLSAFCPVNPQSRHTGGTTVMFGPADNPTFRIDPALGLARLDYQHRVGKLGLDSTAGWLAVVDGAAGSCFVERFEAVKERPYPDNCSVEFWSSGVGRIQNGDSVVEYKDDPKDAPYLVESELLSPFANLAPGQSATFRYSFQAAMIGGCYPVVACTPAGVVCERLRAVGGAAIQLTGRFGVFQPGHVALRLLDANNQIFDTVDLSQVATPLAPLVLHATVSARERTPATVALVLTDDDGRQIGVLDRARLD